MHFPRALSKIFKDYHNSSTYHKLLFSFLITVIVVFLLFSTTVVALTRKNYAETLHNMQDQLLTRSISTNQIILKDLISYCYNLLETPEMNQVLFAKDYDTTTALKAQKLYNGLVQSSSLINSIYFINFRTNTIIDQNSRSKIPGYSDQEIFTLIQNMLPGTSPLFCYPRNIDLIYANSQYKDVSVLTMIFYPNKYGALVINLDYEKYTEMLSADGNNYVELYMADSTGHLIHSPDPALFAQDVSEETWFKEIKDNAQNRGFVTTSYNGNTYILKYVKNEGLGIIYISTLYDRFIYSDNVALIAWITPIIAYLVIGLCLSVIISWIIYSPLRQLLSFINKHADKPKGSLNDFAYIEDAFKEMEEVNSKLINESQILKNHKSKQLLNKLLLQPYETTKNYYDEINELDASFEAPLFRIIVCALDNEPPTEMSNQDKAIYRYAIENVTGELLSQHITSLLILNIDQDKAVFLCNLDNIDTSFLCNIILEAQKFLNTHYQISFSAGIGESVQDMSELYYSLQSANEALSHRFFSGNGHIHLHSDITSSEFSGFPTFYSEAIISSIKALDAKKVNESVTDFITAVSTNSVSQIICDFQLLSSRLEELEKNYYIDPPCGWDFNALSSRTLPDIQKNLYERCINDIGQISEVTSASSKNKALIEQIYLLIDENIENPNLSVTYLADEVHLSVNYLRNLFKEASGESLSGYITEKKLTKICELLKTDISLNDISDKLGFTNKNYFFTFFKKHKGMTPGDYRIQVQSQIS